MARSTRRGRQSGSLTDRLPLKQGAIFGAAAYVVGVVITFVLIQIDSDIDPSEGEFGSALDWSGWAFYNGHFVDTKFSGAGVSETDTIISEGSLPEFLYILVPVAVLIGASYLLMQQTYVSEVSDAALNGATLVVGYLPLAVIGTFLFEASQSAGGVSISAGPETGSAILLAGIVFPLVLGAAGGFLAFQTQDNRRSGMRR